MSKRKALSPQSLWDRAAVVSAFQENDIKPVHAVRLWGYLVRHPGAHWTDVPDFPKAAVRVLEEGFTRFTTKVVKCQTSADGETTKLLIELQDGLQVESVIMNYDTTGRYTVPDTADDDEAPCSSGASVTSAATTGMSVGGRRSTLCVSSQVGCQMGCTFCATGTMGLKGNLTEGEILEQLVHARKVAPIRNIVYMGMGEPLMNYDHVRDAVSAMTDPRLFGLRRRHVTVSTVGVVNRIKQLADDLPGVSLALSLHAPNQALRQTIVPSARAYKLDKLLEAVAYYQQRSMQKIFVEYVMLAGVNDGAEQAHELGALLAGRDMLLNLIPWNPVYVPEGGPAFAAPAQGSVDKFQAIVRYEYQVFCTVRQEKGQDISGACGQLVVQQQSTKGCSSEASGDIEELAVRLAKV